MTVNEAKKILLSTPLKPHVREAINVLLPDLLSYYDLPGEEWRDVFTKKIVCDGKYQVSNFGRARSFKAGRVKILRVCWQNRTNKKHKQFSDKISLKIEECLCQTDFIT